MGVSKLSLSMITVLLIEKKYDVTFIIHGCVSKNNIISEFGTSLIITRKSAVFTCNKMRSHETDEFFCLSFEIMCLIQWIK